MNSVPTTQKEDQYQQIVSHTRDILQQSGVILESIQIFRDRMLAPDRKQLTDKSANPVPCASGFVALQKELLGDLSSNLTIIQKELEELRA